MEKNRNSNSEQSVKTGDIIKSALSDTFKKHKKLVKALVAIALVFSLLIISIGVLKVDSVQRSLFAAFMPEQLTDEQTGVTFYREGSPKDYTEENPQQIKFYYYVGNDSSAGEKIYLQDGVYKTGTDEPDVQVALGFATAVFMNIQTAMRALGWAAGGIAVLAVVLVIVFWYKSFKKHELEEREKYRKSHPRH